MYLYDIPPCILYLCTLNANTYIAVKYVSGCHQSIALHYYINKNANKKNIVKSIIYHQSRRVNDCVGIMYQLHPGNITLTYPND
jgi:hypothetical protein